MSQTKSQLVDPVDGSIVTSDIADSTITTAKVADNAVVTDAIADDAVSLAKLSASGTPSSSNFLRGDNSFQVAVTPKIAFFGQQSTTATSVPNNTWTVITNLTENNVTSNVGSSWDNTAGRFTVASGQEGVYLLWAGVGIDDMQRVDILYCSIHKNGVVGSYYCTDRTEYSGSSAPHRITTTGSYVVQMNLAVGDYVEAKVNHNEGSTEPTEYQNTFFGGVRL